MADRSDYTNVNRIIHKGPCIVKDVHVTSGVGAGYCYVLDGVNAQGKYKARLYVLESTSYTWKPGVGTDFEDGIYIIVNDAQTWVTVTYEPESRKGFI